MKKYSRVISNQKRVKMLKRRYLSYNVCYWGKLKISDFGHFKLANKTIV